MQISQRTAPKRPRVIPTPDRRLMTARMKMGKLDIATLERAYRG